MKKILFISHYYELDGSLDHFYRYICERNEHVSMIAHPLYYDRAAEFPTLYFDKSKKIKERRRSNFGLFNLLIDLFLSVSFVLRYKPTVIVCANNFDTVSATVARRLLGGSFERIIYFSADLSENRFKSSLLNRIYSFIEVIANRNANFVVSRSKSAEKQRLAKYGLVQAKSVYMPNGILLEEERFEKKSHKKNKFVYQGNVNSEHGIFEFLEKYGSFMNELHVIGVGDDLEKLQKLCEKNSIKAKFHGRQTQVYVHKFLQNFDGFGLAPYLNENSWVKYSSPLKILDYISCNVPVLMSNIPEISQEVKKDKLGVVFKYPIRPDLINSSLERFDTKGYEKKAKDFYEQHKETNLFRKIKL